MTEKVNELNDVRKLATIARILDVKPIEGADNIEKVFVLMKKILLILLFGLLANSVKSQQSIVQDSINSVVSYNFRNINYFIQNEIDAKNKAGDYLNIASKQILTGIGLQIFAGGYTIVVSQNSQIENLKYHYFAAGALSLVGLGFEIVGIRNIGKAGVELSNNGVTLKIKF